MLERKCFYRLLSPDNNVGSDSGDENHFSTRTTHSWRFIFNFKGIAILHILFIFQTQKLDEYCSYNEYHSGMQQNWFQHAVTSWMLQCLLDLFPVFLYVVVLLLTNGLERSVLDRFFIFHHVFVLFQTIELGNCELD